MPCGLKMGLKAIKKPPVLVTIDDRVLEKAFVNGGTTMKGLAKQLDWSERQVERWFYQRRKQNRPSTIVKFNERFTTFLFLYLDSRFLNSFLHSCWKLTYYSWAVLFG